jgi:hypothetical protein
MGSRRIADATTSFAVPLFWRTGHFSVQRRPWSLQLCGSVDRAFLNRIWVDLVEIELSRLSSRAPPI